MEGKDIPMPVTPPPQTSNQCRRKYTLEGGYPTDFVEKPLPELQLSCSICLLILKEPYHPVTCKCGTHCCKTCIEPIFETTKCCPICKQHFDGIAPNVALKLLINGKRVYCSFKEDGCEWTGELRVLDAHLDDNCQFFSVACTLCDVPVRRESMFDHRNLYCLKRFYCCEFCEYSSDYTDVTENHIPKCDFAVVKCSNASCDEKMQRKDLGHHIYVCPETLVRCELATLGCDIYFRRRETYDHYERKMPFHMSLMVTHGSKERQKLAADLAYLQSENRELNKKLTNVNDAVLLLREKNGGLLKDNSCTMKDVGLLREEVMILRQKLSDEEQMSTHSSGRVDELQKALKELTISCQTLKYQVNQHTDDMKCLASNAASDAKEILENVKVLGEEMDSQRTADRKSIESLEGKLEELQDLSSVTLASGLGCRPITVVLRDFAKWQVSNAEWTSPSFYLNGYKLCLSAFVNGNPAQKVNGYLSLYVHVMKGENDGKLPWPFQQIVTLELLHPDPSQKNKKEPLPFDSNTETKYTKRVIMHKQAKGWGYARFIQHTELNKFLRGAREFLMIRVS